VEKTAAPDHREVTSGASAFRCGNLFTLHESFMIRTIGAPSAAPMQQVDDGLKTALELPWQPARICRRGTNFAANTFNHGWRAFAAKKLSAISDEEGDRSCAAAAI
jgi:hypothetical protein